MSSGAAQGAFRLGIGPNINKRQPGEESVSLLLRRTYKAYIAREICESPRSRRYERVYPSPHPAGEVAARATSQKPLLDAAKVFKET